MVSLALFILIFFLAEKSNAKLNDYSEKIVFNFIDTIAKRNVSKLCGDSLKKIGPYLLDYNTIPDQKEFFIAAYTSGDAEQFLSRDQDRWVFRAYQCIQAAGEAPYSKSEHPLHFCFGYNEDNEKIDGIAYGICIPSLCYHDRNKLLDEWRLAVSTDNIPIDYTSCTKSRHDKQWYEKPVAVTEFIVHQCFMLIVVVATVYHIKKGMHTKNKWMQILLAFSAKRNLLKLIQMPKDPQSTITCLLGIRFLSMVWTVIGHSFIFVQAYLDNVEEYKNDMVNHFYNQWITNFTLGVDTFLVISATLTSFTWFKKIRENLTETVPTWTSYSYWLRYYRHRVIRLWPAYIYVLVDVGLRASLQHYHPMWPPTDPALQCPIYWWQNVLFMNSLFENRCMPWTWYIGTEFIYYLLSPIFLLLLHQSPRIGFAFSLLIIFLSSMLNIFGMIRWNFPPTQLLWKQPAIFSADFIKHHTLMYIKPQYRIGPYIVGLLLGYYLVIFQKYSVQMNQRSVKLQIIGWILASVACFWAIFGLYPALQGWNWQAYHLFYGGFHRTIFALSMAWLIYACHMGIGGFINTILSIKIFIPLSSLCYSVYLVHMVLVVLTYLLAPFPIVYTTKWPIFAHCFVQLILSYLFGIICALLAELPALNLERIIFQDNHHRNPPMQLAKDYRLQQLKTYGNG
uniref:Acyltransferase 3 domain-containing protein n=1 Tax=Setaria digitata TaxID=48799 RepID=A0A915PPK9_9BILA